MVVPITMPLVGYIVGPSRVLVGDAENTMMDLPTIGCDEIEGNADGIEEGDRDDEEYCRGRLSTNSVKLPFTPTTDSI
jgi:hypothetical protein